MVTAVLLVLLAAVAAAVLYFAKRGHHGELESSAPAQPAPASVAADPNTLSLSLPESETAQAFEGALRLLEKAPTETYDVSAAAKLLGDDIDKNFAFVRDNFAFDPYVGCLRGAQGTLMTGAGNDVDRSLLLAALLKNSGHDVRLARGTLSDTDAARLLARAQQPPVPRPSSDLSVEEAAAITGLPAAELQKLSARAKSIAQEVGQNLDARVQHDVDFIQQKLQGAGIHLEPGAGVSADAVRSHVWVQVQVEGTWKDLDSSFPDSKVGQRFAEPEGDAVAADSLPDDWYQTLRLRVLSLGPGASDPDEILNHQFRVADMVAQPVDLVFAPQDRDDPLAANTFQPTLFAGANRYTGTNIELGPTKAAGDIAGGMLGGLGGGGEEEAGKESEKPLPKILIEVTLEGPGASPERITRLVADTSDVQDSAQRIPEMRDQLVSLYEFVVAVGPVPSQWVGSQVLSFFNQLASHDEKNRMVIPIDLLNLAMAATQSDRRGDQPRRYYARPLLLAQRVRFRHGPGGRLTFAKTIDILHNRVEFLSGDALAAVRQGALETELERAALPGLEVLNTSTVFERAPAGLVRVLGPGNAAELDKMDLRADAKARIAEDLASGYAVIAPSAGVQIAGMPAVGWWRVRPLGGETVGRMQSGEGQGMVEKAITEGGKYLPSAYSAAANAYCKHVGSTGGWCNPCLIAGAGLLGSAIGVYGWAIASGWGAGQIAFTLGAGAYGAWGKGAACGGWAINSGQSAIAQ